MLLQLIHLPADAHFSDLGLERDDAGRLHYRHEPLAACCRANGLDVDMILESELMARFLIAGWYLANIEMNGHHDPVAETILRGLNGG